MTRCTCPHCGKRFPIDHRMVGHRAKCLKCGGGFVIPGRDADEPGQRPSQPLALSPRKPPLPDVQSVNVTEVGTRVVAATPSTAVQVNVAPSRVVDSFGIASLVLGIFSFFVCWIPLIGPALAAIGLSLGIVGIVRAATRDGSGLGFSIAGGSVSLMSLAASLVFYLAWTRTAEDLAEIGRPASSVLPASDIAPDTNMVPLSNPDFRNVAWGMSRTEVKRRETGRPIDDQPDVVVYEKEVAGLESHLGYVFVDNKLTSGGYVFKHKHINNNLYLDDYARLKDLLVKKYGKPSLDDTVWSNSVFKDDPDRWGLALSTGHMRRFAIWDNPREEIRLSISGDNARISMVLNYESEEHGHLLDQQLESEDLNDI